MQKHRRTRPIFLLEPVESRRLLSTALIDDPAPTDPPSDPTPPSQPDIAVSPAHLFPPGTHVALANADSATLSFTLSNLGPADSTAPVTGSVFLSHDATLSDDDVQISSFQAANLPANSNVPITSTVTLPDSDSAQTWYTIVQVNPGDTAANKDSDPTNDSSTSDPVTLAPKHLTLVSVTAPATVTAGQPFTVTATARVTGLHIDDPNFLAASIHRTGITAQLAPSPSPLTLPVETDGSTDPTLVLITTTLTAPDSTIPGTYTLDFTPTLFKGTTSVDGAYAAPTFSVTTDAPYLSLSPTKVKPATVAPMDQITLTLTATNAGGSASSPATVNFFLSPTPTLSETAATILGSVKLPTLAASASSTLTASFKTPTLPPGVYYLISTIQTPDAATFTDTLATSTATSVTLTAAPPDPTPDPDPIPTPTPDPVPDPTPDPSPGPDPVPNPGPVPSPVDLSFTAFSSPKTGTAGSALWVTATPKITNAPTPATVKIRYFLSKDTALSTDDISLGTLPASSNASLKLPPTLAAGDYHVLATIDPQNLIVESDETNNTVASATPLTISVPDLKGNLAPNPASVRPNAPSSLTLTLSNPVGKSVVRKYNVSYYLSDDDTFSPDDARFSKQSINLALNKKQSKTFKLNYKLPATTPLGTRYVIAVLDTPGKPAPAAHLEIASKPPIKIVAPKVTAQVRSIKRSGKNTLVTLRLTNSGTAASTTPVTLSLTTPNSKKPLFTVRRPLTLSPNRSTDVTLSIPTQTPLDASTLSATIV